MSDPKLEQPVWCFFRSCPAGGWWSTLLGGARRNFIRASRGHDEDGQDRGGWGFCEVSRVMFIG